MIIFYGRTYLPCYITIPKRYDIYKLRFLIYDFPLLNSMSEKICVGNSRYLNFDDDGKPELYYIQKTMDNKYYFLFIEFTELNWNGKYANVLCVSIFLKYMVW